MKKSLYLLMFILGFVGLICILFTPMYKFNDEKINKNNTEILAMWIETDASWLADYRDDSEYNKLSDEMKKEYDATFYRYNKFAYAIWNNDRKMFYDVNSYEVINEIYLKNQGKGCFEEDENGNLILPKIEEIMLAERILINQLGSDKFNELKEAEITKEMDYYKKTLVKAMKSNMDLKTQEEVEAYLIKEGKFRICDEFLVLFVGYDQYLIDTSIEESSEKGIYFKQIFTSWSNAFAVDKAVFEKADYKDLSFFDKCKAVVNDINFYNPLPLLLLTIVTGYIFISMIIIIFKGLQGIRGVKYPHVFINSIINIVLCFLLLLLPSLISDRYHMNFHHTEYARLLNMLKFGSFSDSIIISLIIFHITLGISIFGRFFKWGNKASMEE